MGVFKHYKYILIGVNKQASLPIKILICNNL